MIIINSKGIFMKSISYTCSAIKLSVMNLIARYKILKIRVHESFRNSFPPSLRGSLNRSVHPPLFNHFKFMRNT